MNSIFYRYPPLLICLLCYYSLLSSHPSDCNIPTQYSHHKTVSSEHALALVIGLNTNNLATEKGSARKNLYKPKYGVSDGYAWIGSILIIFVLSPFFSISIIGARYSYQSLLLPYGREIMSFTNRVQLSPNLSLRDDLLHWDMGWVQPFDICHALPALMFPGNVLKTLMEKGTRHFHSRMMLRCCQTLWDNTGPPNWMTDEWFRKRRWPIGVRGEMNRN